MNEITNLFKQQVQVPAFDQIKISIASPDDINGWSFGEIKKPETINCAYIAQKRASITCHKSQVTDAGFFMSMPDEAFAMAFATEWFIHKGAEHSLREGWLFE